MTVTIPGYSTLTGNPEAILTVMMEARFFGEPSGDAYINCIVETAQRCYNITLDVQGGTYAERAESLLRAMAANKMIKLED